MSQAYHIEALSPEARDRRQDVVQRLSMRADGVDRVHARAVRLLQRTQAPHWDAGKVEAVRVLDGAGTEVFRWSVWDELTRATVR